MKINLIQYILFLADLKQAQINVIVYKFILKT